MIDKELVFLVLLYKYGTYFLFYVHVFLCSYHSTATTNGSLETSLI